MKYHAWWLASLFMALFFGVGLLCTLAFGVSYLYYPPEPEKASAVVFGQFVVLVICAGICTIAYSEGRHTK